MWVDGMDTSNEDNVLGVRQTAGMVFQNPDNQIVCTLVDEEVGFGPENIGVPTKDIWTRVEESLKAVGMYQYRNASPNKLSGGQKQRVVIAMAVVSRIRTRNRQRVAEMSATMARLETDILDSQRISDTMHDRLKELFADRFETFNDICELWYRNNESAAATANMKRGMEALIAKVSDPATADELDALIDSCSDGWMTHLRTSCPDLTDDQRRLAGYLFTGFSSESIMVLTRRPSVNSVYVAKSRLKKAIAESGAPDVDGILVTLGLAKKPEE